MHSNWILEDSCPDYMLKAEESLRRERDRVSHYLQSSSEQKLVEKVQNELLVVYATQLLEKEHSRCQALLIFRLYYKITKGLDPVAAAVFKQHVTTEGIVLVQTAEDATSNQASNGSDDKYMAYVNDCFINHSLFHKALKEVFEVFCNKAVSGSSSAELLAGFCDNILKKGGSEKLSDETIEETPEKVVKLLAYISDKDLFAAKLTTNAATVRCLVGDALAQLIRNIAITGIGLVISFVASWEMAFTVLLLFSLIDVTGYMELKFIKGFSTNSKMVYEEASQIITDAVGSIKTVVSFCAEEKVMQLYNTKCEDPMRTEIIFLRIFLSQDKYAKDLISRAGLDSCKDCKTPCLPHVQLKKDKERERVRSETRPSSSTCSN